MGSATRAMGRRATLVGVVLLLAAATLAGRATVPREAVTTTIRPAQSAGGASLTGCVVDPADFVGWWKGENNLTATVGPDLTGTVSYAPGVVGQAMAFNGTNIVGVDGFQVLTTGVTAEAWIKPGATMEPQSIIARWKLLGADGDSAYALRLVGNTLVWATDDLSTLRPVELTASVPQLRDGAFHHIAGTWSLTTIAMYVDGAVVASRASQGDPLNAATNTTLRLGSSPGIGDPSYFTGLIDEPAIFRRALTSEEVNAIYSAGAIGKCNPSPPTAQQAKLVAADGTSSDWFGRSTAIDGTTAVVGAPNNGVGGVAYVYTRSGTTWSLQAELTGSDEASGDSFGFAVAVSGDTIVVGAFKNSPASGSGHVLNAGAAYLFTRSNAVWTQQAKLVEPNPQSVDYFGRAVDISGNTIVVGVTFANTLGSHSGAAYVFSRTGSTWTQQARLLASDGAAGDGFGYSVAIDGSTIAIGADLDGDLGTDSGSVYVFTLSGSTWSQQARLNASDGTTSDRFGASVDVQGGTIVVGAPQKSRAGSNSGAAYVFTSSGTTWTQQTELHAADAAAGDLFGYSVELDLGTIIVGAVGTGHNGANSGTVYVFSLSSSSWTQVASLAPLDPGAGQSFGIAVALQNGVAVIGAYYGGNQQGAAYVFDP